MKHWVTEFRAICARTGELKLYCGPHVTAPTFELAQEWCYQNRGWLTVIGELVSEIPCKEGTHDPDWANAVNYDEQQSN